MSIVKKVGTGDDTYAKVTDLVIWLFTLENDALLAATSDIDDHEKLRAKHSAEMISTIRTGIADLKV